MRNLSEFGIRVGLKRVARLMRMASIFGVSRRRAVHTTWRSKTDEKAPELVRRDFTAQERDTLCVADITYVPSYAGFLYLSVVIDVFSRRVGGWSMANHLRSELVTDALDMALCQRRPGEVIHHSDQGSQYTLSVLRQAMQTGRRQALHGLGWRLLRQRRVKRVSSPVWNANCLIEPDLPQRPRPDLPCSNTSRASTIHGDDTLPSDSCHP